MLASLAILALTAAVASEPDKPFRGVLARWADGTTLAKLNKDYYVFEQSGPEDRHTHRASVRLSSRNPISGLFGSAIGGFSKLVPVRDLPENAWSQWQAALLMLSPPLSPAGLKHSLAGTGIPYPIADSNWALFEGIPKEFRESAFPVGSRLLLALSPFVLRPEDHQSNLGIWGYGHSIIYDSKIGRFRPTEKTAKRRPELPVNWWSLQDAFRDTGMALPMSEWKVLLRQSVEPPVWVHPEAEMTPLLRATGKRPRALRSE